MRNQVRYEWVALAIEDYDNGEHDIQDRSERDTLAAARQDAAGFAASGRYSRTEIELVRDEGNDLDGLIDRQFAVLKDGRLPEYFSYGDGEELARVPQRFHRECNKE